VLQRVVARCSVLQKDKVPTLEELNEVFKGEKVLQRVAACCSVLRKDEIHLLEELNDAFKREMTLLKSATVCCRVLQCVAVCCIVLQRTKGTGKDMGWLRLVGSLKF